MMDGIGNSKQALAGLMESRVSEVTGKLGLDGQTVAAPEGDEEAAKAFESYFATMLVKELRRALPEGLFSGAGADVYTAWFDEHVGQSLTSRDALGIGQMVRTSLARRAPEEPADFSRSFAAGDAAEEQRRAAFLRSFTDDARRLNPGAGDNEPRDFSRAWQAQALPSSRFQTEEDQR